MAVPALPAGLANGDVLPESWTDGHDDLAAFFRDSGPVFKGQAWSNLTVTAAPTGVATTFGHGTGTAPAFHFTPDINVGGWEGEGAGNPSSLVVPESGIYQISATVEWPANATGYRYHVVTVNGSSLAGSQAAIAAVSSVQTRHASSTLADLTAGDDLFVRLLQNSGSDLLCTVHLTAVWIRST